MQFAVASVCWAWKHTHVLCALVTACMQARYAAVWVLGEPHARARSQTARLMQPARAGVIACAVIMTIATLAVIESAARDLTAGFFHGAPLPPYLWAAL